jgi:AraC-like DNA-binding protein
MSFQEIKSKAELSKFVESYWSYQSVTTNPLILLPDGTFNILIAKAPFTFLGIEFPSGIYLLPILTTPIQLFTKQSLIGIRCKAFSMVNIVGKKVHLLASITPIEAIINEKTNVNFQLFKISEHFDIHALVPDLENFMFDLLRRRFELNENLRSQVNYILDRKGDIRISNLCENFGISRQALHKSFSTSLGISPKELAMVWRLNHCLTLTNQTLSLTETALDAGFFDQAHSINTFKKLWNFSPSQFQKLNPAIFEFSRQSMINRFKNGYDPEI